MNNAQVILESLGRRLDHKVELTLYGRSAIALGFSEHQPQHASSMDVDVVIPFEQLDSLRNDLQFWDAIDACNDELKSEGLYLTHTYSEMDVIIRPDWVQRRVSIPFKFKNLELFRPDNMDFILTKMMRDDREDLADIQFLLSVSSFTKDELSAAFNRARVPAIPELQAIFQAVQPKVIELLEG